MTAFMLSVGEILILISVLLFTFAAGVDIREAFRIKKVKPLTLILVIPFTYMMLPLIAACNAFTLIFTDIVVVSASDKIVSLPVTVTFMIIAVFGPFTEELTFRDCEYAGLRNSGNVRMAIVVQALMFGLMHLNLNQFIYAFVIGIAVGILGEFTGSIIPGFLAHLIINGSSVVSMYYFSDTETASAQLSGAEAFAAMNIYSLVAVFTTAIAILILFAIACIENGGRERLDSIIRPARRYMIRSDGSYVEAKAGRTLTIPALAGIILAVGVVIVTLL